jgi:hypothetical protein
LRGNIRGSGEDHCASRQSFATIVACDLYLKPRLSIGLAVAQACNVGFEQERIAQTGGDGSRQYFHTVAKRA